LREPEFRDDKLDLTQKEYFDAISRRNDDVDNIAAREAAKLVYGPQNPYARVAEYKTVAAVTRQDLVNWHHTYVQPNNIILGIVGDFDAAAMEAKLRQAYGTWARGTVPKEEKIEPQPAKPGYYLVEKEDVNQSSISMLGLGIRRDNPDYYAVRVFNEAFGGGFSSRLMQSIRTAKGLAYAVGGGIGSSFDHLGTLRLQMGTKSGSTIEAIQALDEQIDGVTKDPVSETEIKRAKDSILNGFVFNLDSPEKILREQMTYEFYGYSLDYLDRFRAGVEKVTPADVARLIADPAVRFDYYCWDLYARTSAYYKESPESLAWRRETLHAIEAGAGAQAEIGVLVADAVVQAHLKTMLRLGVEYDVLPRESEILHLKFWATAF
jgi:zinc protease